MEVGEEEAASKRKVKGVSHMGREAMVQNKHTRDRPFKKIYTCREKCKVEASHLHPTEHTHLRVTLRNDWA